MLIFWSHSHNDLHDAGIEVMGILYAPWISDPARPCFSVITSLRLNWSVSTFRMSNFSSSTSFCQCVLLTEIAIYWMSLTRNVKWISCRDRGCTGLNLSDWEERWPSTWRRTHLGSAHRPWPGRLCAVPVGRLSAGRARWGSRTALETVWFSLCTIGYKMMFAPRWPGVWLER